MLTRSVTASQHTISPSPKAAARSALNRLYTMIDFLAPSSKTALLIKLVEGSYGMNKRNFLPWKDSFRSTQEGPINRITCAHLKDHPIGWGFDAQNRLFVTFQYVTNQKGSRDGLQIRQAFTVFQGIATTAVDAILPGNFKKHFQLSTQFDPNWLYQLKQLFKGHVIEQSKTSQDSFKKPVVRCFSLATRHHIASIPSID